MCSTLASSWSFTLNVLVAVCALAKMNRYNMAVTPVKHCTVTFKNKCLESWCVSMLHNGVFKSVLRILEFGIFSAGGLSS